MKKAIICDLDGTLSFVGDRTYYNAKKCDITDTLNKPVAEVVKLFKKDGYRIIFITGRYENSRNATKRFIENHLGWIEHIDYELYMRGDRDFRKDFVFKGGILKNHIEGKYEILFVLEDRDQMVDFYRSINIPCFQVNPEKK